MNLKSKKKQYLNEQKLNQELSNHSIGYSQDLSSNNLEQISFNSSTMLTKNDTYRQIEQEQQLQNNTSRIKNDIESITDSNKITNFNQNYTTTANSYVNGSISKKEISKKHGNIFSNINGNNDCFKPSDNLI